MASGVNVKMGVSGLSQFKNAMTQAKQATKTLDAQLALTEKQFKQTGDAESYMAEKSELLKAKLEQQKKVVTNAEKALEEMRSKGVDTSSKSYQDLYRSMIQAKGAMIDTENELNGVAEAGANAAAGVDGMNEQLKAVGDGISYQNVTDALDKITGGMETVIKKAVEVGKAIVKDVLGAGSWADDLNTRAAYFGLEPEELQRMEKTAALIDTSVESIVKSRKKLMTNVGKGNKATDEALDTLGIEYLGDAEDTFWKAGEAIMKLSDEAEKEAKANALFGKSWSELIPLFTAGREEYEKLNASWSVVDKEQVQALQDLDDEYQKLSIEFETVKKKFDASIAQGLTPVMQTLTGLMKEFNKYLESPQGKEMLDALGKAVGSLFEDLANVDPQSVVQTITGVIDDIKKALEWIKDNKDGVVTAVEAFIAAWAGLETAKGVTIALQLITGIKNLRLPGAPSTPAEAASAGTAANTTGIGSSGPIALGLGGLAAIGYGFYSAADRRINRPETVRGTDQYLQAQSAGAESLLVEYLKAQQAQSELDWMATETEVDEITARVQEAWKKLEETEGGMEALQAYSDWRQEHSYGNDYWEIPEYLQQAVDEMTGETGDLKKSTDDMGKAADAMNKTAKNLPSDLARLLSGLKVEMNEQVIGRMVSEYLASGLD